MYEVCLTIYSIALVTGNGCVLFYLKQGTYPLLLCVQISTKKIENCCRPTVAFHQLLNMQLLQIGQMYVCLWIPLDTYKRLYATLNQRMEMFKLNIRGFCSKFSY